MSPIAPVVAAALAIAAIGWSSGACAQQAPASAAPPGQDWIALAPDRLDRLRGGYALPSGLVLSFGFQRTVAVNGALVSALRVDVPDIARITPEQARELARLQAGQLVQIGPGNVATAGGGGLVIQNTLDGQDIRATTTIDVSTNALGLFQALNAGDAAQRALIGSTGGP